MLLETKKEHISFLPSEQNHFKQKGALSLKKELRTGCLSILMLC